jgi:two-component system LytT family response regulator
MINAVIIDDEVNAIETLKWKLAQYCPEVTVVATFDDPVLGKAFLRANPPDLLFLDIEMPMLNGFDILEDLDRIRFDVIFTTAYENYGIMAVKFSALDYLLKPVRNKELTEAVERFKEKRWEKHDPNQQVRALLHNLREEEELGRPSRITLATKESLELVEPREIIYCASDSNYTMVYLTDGRKKLISRTLREFEDMLTPFDFYRPHNSYLVNMALVREYIKVDGGYLVLKNQVKIPVSKSRKEGLLSYFST